MNGPRSERGAATFVMVGVLAVVISLAVAGLLLGGYVVAIHRARSGADLVALSGAAAFEQGAAACPVARRTVTPRHSSPGQMRSRRRCAM